MVEQNQRKFLINSAKYLKYSSKDKKAYFHKNKPNTNIYEFKSNYYSKYSKNEIGKDSPVIMSVDGLIQHDVESVADKFIINSQNQGQKGQRNLKKLRRMILPIPSSQQS
jgi:hypothetical protein